MATITQSNYDNFLTWQKVNGTLTLTLLQTDGMPGYIETEYSAKAQEVFDKMPNPLTKSEKTGMATFIDQMVTDGNWAKLDCFYGFFLSDIDNACTSWIGTKTATRVSSPTHDNKGFLFNGITQYIDSNINMGTDLVNALQNNNYVGVFVKDDFGSTTRVLMGYSGASPSLNYHQTYSTGSNLQYSVNDTVTSTVGEAVSSYDSNTYYAIYRDFTNKYFEKNGISVSAAQGSLTLSPINYFIGARNNNGTTTDLYTNCKLSFWSIGSTPDLIKNKSALDLLINHFELNV